MNATQDMQPFSISFFRKPG